MLYLAEVLKKTGFMGAKTELKLLARQQSDQNWVALPGDELIATDAASDYGSGVLVLVELGANNQLKGIEEATRQLISILKNFSKMKEKFVSQEEEIEGWKQSLIYQSQELTRREVDMESRAEEIGQWESESEKIQQQRQEFEETKAQILALKNQIEVDRQQLEEGWGKLQQSQRDFDTRQAEHGASLSDSQVEHIESLLNQLESSGSNGDFTVTLDAFETRLIQAHQSLAEDRQRLEELARQVKQHEVTVAQNHQDVIQAQQQLREKQIELSTTNTLIEQQKVLQHRLREQEMFYDSLGESLQQVQVALVGEDHLEMVELWDLPLEELQEKIQQLSQELTKLRSFVEDQEEELTLQLQEVEGMREKMAQASEYERLTMQSDLEAEEQHYKLLNETLEGQRQSLQERANVLQFHQKVLEQRSDRGQVDDSSERPDLAPALKKFNAHCQSHRAMLTEVEEQIQNLSIQLVDQQEGLNNSETQLQNLEQGLEEQDRSLNQQKLDLGICQGKVEVYQAFLDPIEEQMTSLRNLKSSAGDESDRSPIIAELKQTLMTLSEEPNAVKL
ncbi:MAG: pilus motility taxis protein HmpF [Cyanobacteria bacterium P01_F01_bin.42]